jgi:hypothetical protein
MDGKGRWIDNVFIERLWRSVRYEEVYRRLGQHRAGGSLKIPSFSRPAGVRLRAVKTIATKVSPIRAIHNNGAGCRKWARSHVYDK